LDAWSSSSNRIADNVILGEITIDGGSNNRMVGNEISGPGNGIVLEGKYDHELYNTTVADNVIRDNDGTGIVFYDIYVGAAERTTIAGNRIVDNEAGIVLSDVGDVTISGSVIRENNQSGVVLRAVARITVEQVRIVDNGGDGVAVVGQERYWGSPGVTVRDAVLTRNQNGLRLSATTDANATWIHDSTLAGNREFGVLNEGDGTVNATGNYWGAADGPGSNESDPDAPYTDPVTGALADGSGDWVSEDPNRSGVSNVRFDPYLTEPRANGSTSTVADASARTNGDWSARNAAG
jgi:parallel beta-helix repeat protein